MELPESVEFDIETLSKKQLRFLMVEIAEEIYSPYVSGDPSLFESEFLTVASDEYIDTLDTRQLISLMKWLCDRIESLLTKN